MEDNEVHLSLMDNPSEKIETMSSPIDECINYVIDKISTHKVIRISTDEEHINITIYDEIVCVSFENNDQIKQLLAKIPENLMLIFNNIPMDIIKDFGKEFLSKIETVIDWHTPIFDQEVCSLLFEMDKIKSITYFPEMYDLCEKYPDCIFKCTEDILSMINKNVGNILLDCEITDNVISILSNRFDKNKAIYANEGLKIVEMNKFVTIDTNEIIPKEILDQNDTVTGGRIPTEEPGYDKIIFARNRKWNKTKNARNQ